jgi:hypothetical protein
MPLSWNLTIRWGEKLRRGSLVKHPFLIAAALWAVALCPSQAALLPVAPDDVPLLNLSGASASNHVVIGPETMARLSDGRLSAWRGRGEGGFSLALDLAPSLRNLSGFLYVAADVRNLGPTGVTMLTRVEDPDYAGWHHYSEGVLRLPAGESGTVLVLLKRNEAAPEPMRALFPGMQGLPGGYLEHWNGLDPARISKVLFLLEASGTNVALEWSNLRATGPLVWPETNGTFFPFVDRFGQYRHAEWPAKVHSTSDLVAQHRAEAEALSRAREIPEWDKFGGWKNGPRLKATGHFRVEQCDGTWWFVDPEGCLFWSHGTCCVGVHSATPFRERRYFFSEIPATTKDGADFYLSNLRFKYGADAERQALACAHQRFRAWGLNTIGAWSHPVAIAMKRRPYTAILHIDAPRIAPGLDVPDVYNRAFPKAMRAAC